MIKARVTYAGGMTFVARANSGHAVVMDGDPKHGGEDSAPRPVEMLLFGLGGCTGMDVIGVLNKKRQHVTGLEIALKGDRASDDPKRFTEVTIEFTIRGRDVSEEAVKRAISLSMEKYCSVKATFEHSAKVMWDYRIVEE